MPARTSKRLTFELLRHLGRSSRCLRPEIRLRQLACPYSKSSGPLTPSPNKTSQEAERPTDARLTRFAPLTILAAGSLLATVLAISQPEVSDCSLDVRDTTHSTSDNRDPALPRFRLSTVRAHDASHPSPWVTHGDKVYDITAWVPAHPGGDVILRAAGGSIDPYWDIFTIHKAPYVVEILGQYLIGYIDMADLVDGQPPADPIEDPFARDPKRDARLITHTAKPRNAEPPGDWLANEFLTPAELFYVRNHMWVPAVGLDTQHNNAFSDGREDSNGSRRNQRENKPPGQRDAADSHVLTVELPDGETRTYTLAELRRRFQHHTVTASLQCSGNRRSDMSAHVGRTKGLPWGVGAISNAEWEGVRLADVLADAGLRVINQTLLTATTAMKPDSDGDPNLITAPSSHHVHLHGLEAYAASIPLPTALDPRGDVLLAFRMNGAPLPRDHGFPLRALVPGHVAARSVKWLNRISVADEEVPSQWQRRDYKSFGPNEGSHPDWDRAAAIQEMPVTSAITRVWVGEGSHREGHLREAWTQASNCDRGSTGSGPFVALQGYAYSGGGREIRRVDVSLDAGETWNQATLLDDCATPATAAISSSRPCKGSKAWAWKRWRFSAPLPALSAYGVVNGEGGKLKASPDIEAEKGNDKGRRRRCMTLVVKATDDAYNTQPRTHAEIYNARGNLATAWHRVRLCPSYSMENNGSAGQEKTTKLVWGMGNVSGCGFSAHAEVEVNDKMRKMECGKDNMKNT